MPHKDPARRKAYQVAYRATSRAKWLRARHVQTPRWRAGHLRRRYGITTEQYDTQFERQGKACAICRSTSPGWKKYKRWCVDHDHKTGEFRGILCRGCNLGIGNLKDDPALCARAAEYLGEQALQ